MSRDLTDINIVVDRSGSMNSIKDDTIGGFNAFLKTQQEMTGEAVISLHRFDDIYETVYEAINIKDAPKLDNTNFVPRGNTALLDAIGRTINSTGTRLAKLDESQRPDKVIFVIITDGHENASKEFTNEVVANLIKHQTEVYSWQFLYIGANQDAIAVGINLNISASNSITLAADAQGTRDVFESTSRNIASYRGSGQSTDLGYTVVDRERQDRSTSVSSTKRTRSNK